LKEKDIPVERTRQIITVKNVPSLVSYLCAI
jgi:hypothetical protein